MAGYEQYGDECFKSEQISEAQTDLSAENDERLQYGTIYPDRTFDDYNGSLSQFALLPVPYGDLEYTNRVLNYQIAFPHSLYNPHGGLQAHSGVQPINMNAPNHFPEATYPEQPWVEEIHTTYTPGANPLYQWTPEASGAYGWLVDTSAAASQQAIHWDSPGLAQVDQFSPQDPLVYDTHTAQLYAPQITSRLPIPTALSAEPISMALKVRNDKFKKDFTMPTHTTTEIEGQRPLRVSKTKKGQKAEHTGKQEACWRCKRYRKACIGGEVCKECSTAGFRVWPSAIGCRRGAMEGFIEKIMPSHSIGVLRNLRTGVSRNPNWRKALIAPDSIPLSPGGTNPADRWDLLKIRVQSTMVFGKDFSTLVDIGAAYEKSQSIEVPVWTQSITLLSSTCDFYHFFVASSNTEVQLPNLINATLKFRKSLLRSWDLFLKLCLSGRRENWFPAFLSVVLGICSMVILMDAVASVPHLVRKAIWSDIEAVIKDLRVRQYMMSLDLLRIGAKGINPLKLDYWEMEEQEEEDGEIVLVRNAKGMALLGQDSAAFDGFIALRKWHLRYKAVMREGNGMWDSVPYTLTHVQAVAALSRVFEF